MAGRGVRGHRRLLGGAALPARHPDPRRPRRRAQHEGHRAGRHVRRGQAVPARLVRRPRPVRGGVRRRARRQDDGRVRRQPGHRRRRLRTGPGVRRPRVRLQPRHHAHPRGAAGRRRRRAGAGLRGDRARRPRGQHGGRAADRPLDTIGSEAVEEALRVNYLAPIHIARAAFPYLAKTGGRLLLYTSSSYTRGRADYSLYSSAKAATVNLTQALADEWSADGVLINCINPERTSTPMRTAAFGQEPPHTLLSADQVARTSLNVLLSGLTGQVVDVRREDPLAGRARRLSPLPRPAGGARHAGAPAALPFSHPSRPRQAVPTRRRCAVRRLVSRYSTLVRYSTVLSLPVMLILLTVAGASGSPAFFLGAMVLCYLAEQAVLRVTPDAARALRWGQMPAGARVLARQAAFVLLLVQDEDAGTPTVTLAAAGFVLLDWIRAVALAGAVAVRRVNRLPFVSRNLGPNEPALPRELPEWQTRLIGLLESRADFLPSCSASPA
ncbi:SDR family oxidoreductase [Actinomadura madurae]|uniref:SDR family oxidoreductase n=1 Tax=Actinomadura madurae TaxID=1993 RepID=UPI0027E2E4F2|nr:SDR family oxidoreductase [Actinomadura madurae]